MPAAHWSLVNGATNAATGSTLAKRDANADITFRNLLLQGKITSYNGITTVGLGAEIVVFELASGILGGNSAAATMYTAPATGGYRVAVIVYTIGNGADAINVVIGWTTFDGVAKTRNIPLGVQSNNYSSDTFSVYALTGTAITYAVTGSTGSGSFRMQILLTRLS
jgi:hypothetical protein